MTEMENAHTVCWSCHGLTPQGSPFCETCGAIQPLVNQNPFALFGVPVSFTVDKPMVEQRYIDLQKQLHPDNFTHKTMQEQMHALTWGSYLNDAYNALIDNIKLSCLMLEINGLVDILNSKPSATLMAEQFMLREELEDAESAEGLSALQTKVDDKIKLCYNALVNAFKEENFPTAVEKTIELRFLNKFMADIKKQKRKYKK